MPLINTSVPNLIQGVSQQPDPARFAGQCEEQENALSSVSSGLIKRPNTRHIKKLLDEAISEESFVHFIDRSDEEKYVVIHDGTHLYCFNTITGEEAQIKVGNAIYNSSFTVDEVFNYNNSGHETYYVRSGYPISGTYLDTGPSPLGLMKALTVADTTFLLNTFQSVALDRNSAGEIKRTPGLSRKSLIFIKQGDYEKEYGITVNAAEESDSALLLPTIRPLLTRYTASSWSHKHGNFHGSKTHTHVGEYRWRLTGLNITGGANITGNLKLTFKSNTSFTAPTVEFTIDDTTGGISDYKITNPGDFAGTGNNTVPWRQHSRVDYGYIQPVVTITVTEENGFNTSPQTASIISDNSDGDKGNATDSDKILELLLTHVSTGSTDLNGENDGIRETFDTSFNIKKSKNLIEFEQPNEDYRISGFDGLSNTGIGVVYREVGSITDLPLTAPDGFVVKVRGDAELNSDDYYVKFETEVGVRSTIDNINSKVGKGVWVETAGPNIELGPDPETLPKILKNTALNRFEILSMDIAERTSGDNYTNPLPSFMGKRINNITFYKDRLILLSEDNIIMSEAGLGVNNQDGTVKYNFSRTTVTTLLDSDPIDITTTSDKVTDFQYALGFQENLILFSQNQQFVLKGGDLLTPRTVSITPITNFNLDTQVSPITLGSYIYFPFDRGRFTGVREFAVNSTGDTYDSVDITEHVPAYVPFDIVGMIGTSSEDLLILLSHREPNALYVYKYFWNNKQKVLSAWSKFTFSGNIRSAQFNDSTLSIVMVTGDGDSGETNLVEMPLEDGIEDTAGFLTHLDMRCYKTVNQGDTTINLPYTPANNSIEVYHKDGTKLAATNTGAVVTLSSPMATSPNIPAKQMIAGEEYTIVSVGTTDYTQLGAENNTIGTTFYATGASNGTGVVSERNVWVGIPYTMKYKFSEQLFKAKAGGGSSPSNAAKLQLRSGSVYYDETSHFKIKVTPPSGSTYTTEFDKGSTLEDGFLRFPILSSAEDIEILIENDSAMASKFQSAEFESFVHTRSSRYG